VGIVDRPRTGSAGLYAAVNLGDPTLAALNLLNAACCLVVDRPDGMAAGAASNGAIANGSGPHR